MSAPADALLRVPRPALLAERLGGLTILERQLFLLRRAGAERVRVAATRPVRPLRLPDGLDVSWDAAGPPPTPYLALSGEYLVRLEALKRLARQGPARWEDAGGRSVVEVVDGTAAAPARRMEPGEALLVREPVGGALPWLLGEAVKSTDGFMARHVDRHVSLAATRRLLDTRVTPNMVTVASTCIGVTGALLLLAATRAADVTGTLLILLHSTVDGVDGELARLRFQESPLGGALDFWGDNVVHAALFLCLGGGLARTRAAAWPLALGCVAAASAAASAGLAYIHSRRKARDRRSVGPFFSGVADVAPGTAGPARRLAALEDALAQRDFVYLLVLLAAMGRLSWFLWASAVGSPLFLAGLVWLQRDAAPRARPEFV